MSEFKGTKGKWMNVNGDILACHVDEEDYGFAIASVEFNPQFKSGVAEANALLISKAPEMLEMLKTILNKIEESEYWWMDVPERGGFNAIEIEELIKQATESK